jgi:predicted DNA-binding transcriptional regulator YafY
MYERAEDLLNLAIRLQGSTAGISLDDIQAMFGVQRRTAERMRDAVARLFGPLETRPSDDRRLRWALPANAVGLVTVSAEELAQLHSAAEVMVRENRPDAARTLEGVADKLRALGKAGLGRVEPDLEALIEAEGLAQRPGPRHKIDPDILAALRTAILECRRIRIRYRGRGSGEIARHKLCPYGFLYGSRPYLIAFSLNPEILDYRTYRISNILTVEQLDEPFRRDPAFSLDAFARRSFGVFQEEPFDVVWRFKPEAAEDARDFVFHPDQRLEEQPDGSLIVRFRAGGALEMSWHLYTWGDVVEVLEPKSLMKR